jgi:putative SOS response-associated peptidase YedK
MCGRLKVDDEYTFIAERFHTTGMQGFDWKKIRGGDVFPGTNIPVISKPLSPTTSLNEMCPILWGWFFYAKGKTKAQVKRSIINSNTATILDGLDNPRKSYLKGLATKRVIIPATAFYEWPNKVKTEISVKDQRMFAIAGYKVACQKLDGGWIETVVLITRDRDEWHVHDAEPVILRPEDEKDWIACKAQGREYLESIFSKPNPDLEIRPAI